MSLKAKIEAVIYASEEPVTLAQLVGLLGEEAQAELDRIAAAQQELQLSETTPEADAAASAEAGDAGTEAAQTSAETDAAPAAEAVASTEEAAAEVTEQSAAPVEDAVAASTGEAAAAAKAEKARAARLRSYFRGELDRLIAEYSSTENDRGIEVREVAGGFRFATKPEYHDAVRGFVKSLKPPLKLTLPALETLAVIAYKQPVTAPEISEIRGVDSGGTLSSLISRKLITTAGRKQVIGRPMLYKTSKEFLLKFGLKDLNELPSIEEFEKMAGQFAEQEEIPMHVTEGEMPAAELAADLGQEAEQYQPREEDGGGAADNVSEETGDRASVDGRISSLPPDYAAEDQADDPGAQEALIQSEESTE